MWNSNDNSDKMENWRWVKLSDIADVNPKTKSNNLSDELEVTFLPMKAVEEKTSVIDLSIVKPLIEVKKGYKSFADGDIIFAKITPCMENGKIALVDGLKNGIGFGSTEFHVIRFTNDCDPNYYLYYFLQDSYRKDAQRKMTGTAGQLRVPTKFIEESIVPLPPLAEQHRIVAKIEELFTQLDAGVESLKKAKEQLRQYHRSLLYTIFEGNQTQEWNSCLINDFAIIQSGYAFKSEWFSEDGIRLVRNANISHGYIDWTDTVKIPEERRGEFNNFKLIEGDILISLDRPIISTGLKVAMVRNIDIPSLLLQRVGRVCFKNKEVLPEFFYAWLKSPTFIATIKPGRSLGIPHISPKEIQSIEFKYPMIREQKKIAGEIESQFSIIYDMEKSIDQSLARAETLRQSILKQAFSGNLVPQNPNDEPAEKLLERIRAERLNQQTGKPLNSSPKRGRKQATLA